MTSGFSLLTTGALATAPVARELSAQPAAQRPSRDMARAVQTSLFPDKPASNVVLIAPARPKPATRKPRTRTARRVPEGQGKLEFLEAAPAKPRTLGTTVEARIYCDAPVAAPLHRAVAAALDWSMVLIAYGSFLLAFRLFGGQVVLNRINLMVFAGTLLLVGFTYGLLPVIAGTETPGMRWTKLRLTTFDGFPLDPHHRLLRMLGSCLSVCTGVGLLWSLVDEESLTWQDHISRTFPTLALDR